MTRNLSYRVSSDLKAAGHDAVHVSEIGLASTDDEIILARAKAEERVLVSAISTSCSFFSPQGIPPFASPGPRPREHALGGTGEAHSGRAFGRAGRDADRRGDRDAHARSGEGAHSPPPRGRTLIHLGRRRHHAPGPPTPPESPGCDRPVTVGYAPPCRTPSGPWKGRAVAGRWPPSACGADPDDICRPGTRPA